MNSKTTDKSNKTTDKSNEETVEPIQLDEIMKSLFSCSDKVIIDFINGAFDRNYSYNAKIEDKSTEFVDDRFNFRLIDADMRFKIVDGKEYAEYHIEFQTKYCSDMAIRMFEYGFSSAKQRQKQDLRKTDGIITLYFPKQLVIYLEEDPNIQDKLTMNIIFPDGTKVTYTVPILKNWEYSCEELLNKKMYVLLPLQVFKFRKQLESVYKSKGKDREVKLNQLLKDAEDTAYVVAKASEKLYYKSKIYDVDFEKFLLAIQNLITYLNKKYVNNKEVEREMSEMVKTLYDPAVEAKGKAEGIKKGKIEMAKNLLKEGIDISIIIKASGLSKEEIEKLN